MNKIPVTFEKFSPNIFKLWLAGLYYPYKNKYFKQLPLLFSATLKSILYPWKDYQTHPTDTFLGSNSSDNPLIYFEVISVFILSNSLLINFGNLPKYAYILCAYLYMHISIFVCIYMYAYMLQLDFQVNLPRNL